MVDADGRRAWATCPLTENGVIRIVGHSKYPNTPDSPAIVAAVVARLRQLPGHQFWPDDISLLASDHVDPARLLTSRQVTDAYLLALAAARGARLATFDRRIATASVREGKSALAVIGDS